MTKRKPDDPYLGALLGLACGDALGAPVEFLPKAEVEARHGRLTEMVGGGRLGWARGEWTDDTGMALAVAEGILANPEDPVAAVGGGFLSWVATAKDVGGTISAALANAGAMGEGRHRDRPLQESISRGEGRHRDRPLQESISRGEGRHRDRPLQESISRENGRHRDRPLQEHESQVDRIQLIDWALASRTTPEAKIGRAAGNGSLMRTLPVALAYPEMGRMLDASARISAMTHWDPQAELCCAIYCLWIREILYGDGPLPAWERALELGREVAAEGRRFEDSPGPTPLPDPFWSRLEAAPGLRLEDLQPSGYAGYVVDCLEAAVWAAVNTDSLEEALVTLVNLGGETDTMAAVAGGAVGARFGLQEVPSRWMDALYQRERVERAAQGLYELRHHQIEAVQRWLKQS